MSAITTAVTVPATAQPWSFTGGINASYAYGDNDGTAPVVVSLAQYPAGTVLQINWVSGLCTAQEGVFPWVNGAGFAGEVTGDQPGNSGNYFPTRYTPTSQLGLCGLYGAITDLSGNVITPFPIGLGAQIVVPSGAVQLQIGTDDDIYHDNQGEFVVDVFVPGWLIADEPLTGSPAIGGLTDRSGYLYTGDGAQHSLNLQVRQRGNATYTLRVAAGDSYEPTQFQPVYLCDQNAAGYQIVFFGLIQSWKHRQIGTSGWRYIDVTAVSLESVFDTVYAQPLQFVNQTCGAILTALFNAFETGCPVTLGQISDGPTVPLFVANYEKLSDLFTQLATTAGFTWGVNPQTQQLYFCLPSAATAPFSITPSDALWDSIEWEYDGAEYRNRQAVKLSYDAFSHSMEFFTGAGQTSFTLMRPVNQVTNAYVTLSTPNHATGSFSGQPSPGDTITISPASGSWMAGVVYAIGGAIVVNGYVQKVTYASGTATTGTAPTFSTVTGGTVSDSAGNIWTCQGPLGISTGSDTYTFVSTLDNTQFGQVLIAATLAATVQNLADAINANASVRGATFSLPTWENSLCNAISVTGTGFTLQQKAAGTGYVSSLSKTGSAFSWGSNVTAGGTSPQGSVGPNEGATITIQVYAVGTSTAAPGLAYQQGSATITLATPLNSGTNLNVEYTRMDGAVIEVEDTALVEAVAAVSNGTGKYQQITDQSSQGLISTSAAAGLQLAQQALAAFSPIPLDIKLRMLVPGIFPGQEVTLALSGYMSLLNGTYYVEELSSELVPVFPYMDSSQCPGAGHYRYTLKLIDVAEIGSYMDFWEGIGGGGSGGTGSGALVATSGGAQSSSGTGALSVDATQVSNPNLSDTTPAAGSGYVNVKFQTDGTNVSAEIPIAAPPSGSPAVAKLGVVYPDGVTIQESAGGGISVPTATTSALGLVKPDGTTITISSGVITAVSGGGGGSGIGEYWGELTFSTPPAIGSFTQDNFGTATYAENPVTGVLRLRSTGASGNNNEQRSLLMAIPTATSKWQITARIRLQVILNDWFSGGIVMKDSVGGKYEIFAIMIDATNKFAFYGVSAANWGGGSSYGFVPTSLSPTPVINTTYPAPEIWMRVYYDGTNLNYSWSYDGTYWHLGATVSGTHYLANVANQCGLTINDNNAGTVREMCMDCASFSVVNI